ncbi:MarR family winged helix-turn-helix transcriptional regulator [Streptomyces sp. NBC_01142]|uniref:MarR family winged helix-turn-helix transcriptional regulator n=1 Tax=Streptomyces sp. NBC_01142 TaxID=2975865 RepID=UPI002254FEAA|nr:MarR family winged helix-turn-helix transcriptional regulator [Streptomyces sp. NBC_01142]MCX4820856.1 MarR family winged helix-turn-helix transcriptional regulator [Streptomyces sp. NBC_01142]
MSSPATEPGPGPELLGTRLRHLLGLLEADVTAVYSDLGLDGFRPRYAPSVRTLAADGPRSIQDLAHTIGVTHSAASQTVSQLVREGLATIGPGKDARRRIVRLTPKAEALLPALEAEWAATTAAAATFEAELPFPLSELIGEALEALHRRPMRQRIADAAPGLIHPPGCRPDTSSCPPHGG